MLVSPWILPPIDIDLALKKGGWKTILSSKTRSSTRVELWTVGGINTKQLWNYQIINPMMYIFTVIPQKQFHIVFYRLYPGDLT